MSRELLRTIGQKAMIASWCDAERTRKFLVGRRLQLFRGYITCCGYELTPEGSCETVGIHTMNDRNSHHSILEVDIGSNPDLMMSGHLNRSSESTL